MNREQILNRIAEIDAELERRREDCRAISEYNTGKKKHKKQLAFHKCKKRNRWVFGGNRSGKTECGAVEAIWMLRGIHPYRKNRKDVFGWAVSLSQQVQRDVAQSKILKYLPKSWIADITMLSGRKDSPEGGVIDQIKIKNVFGGISTLGFKSCDQGREKFQGSSLDFVWLDEEPPKEIYEECLMRVMDKKGDIFGTMTPLKGETFIYIEIYLNRRNNPHVWCEFVSWE
ncbi:MAG: terminase family protein, partial [Clostridia bacterium]|nr:terminase family protein [Clostridia bacterium]